MDAVSLCQTPEPPSAEVIDLAAYRKARADREAPPPAPADPYPWAYTFQAPAGD